MKYNIIHIENYLLVVSDEEIKESYDWNNFDISDFSESIEIILAHKPLNGAPYLEGIDVLPEIEDRSNSDLYYHKQVMNPYGTGEQSYTAYEKGFIEGYNKAKETHKYTDEDLIKVIDIMCENYTKPPSERTGQNEIIQSLNQPKLPVAFESDPLFFDPQLEGYLRTGHIQKTITNSEGRTEWVGTYKF